MGHEHLSPTDGHTYFSTKTYDHNIGLSCCFRQWRAKSHCRFLHGYALKVKMTFELATFGDLPEADLNENNWVIDFGSLKPMKSWLETQLDHKTLVAVDDPEIVTFQGLHDKGLIQMVIVPSTGCEAVARIVFDATNMWLKDKEPSGRVILRSVEVSEHSGNSAGYKKI